MSRNVTSSVNARCLHSLDIPTLDCSHCYNPKKVSSFSSHPANIKRKSSKLSYKSLVLVIVDKIIVYETYLQDVSAEADDRDERCFEFNIAKI